MFLNRTRGCLAAGVAFAALSMSINRGDAQSRMLDSFDTLEGWRPTVAEGARLSIVSAKGETGNAMQMTFDLSAVSGYVIAEKDFAIDLPQDYEFTFDMRADAPVNNFEFKVIDDRENVFWIKKLNIEYPREWTHERVRKRQLTFAWGPAPGNALSRVRKIQFVVSTGTGGKGTVWLDNFRFVPIDDTAGAHAVAEIIQEVTGRVGRGRIDPAGTVLSGWRSGWGEDSLTVDFHRRKELSALVIDWDSADFARAYDILLSDNGSEWYKAYSVSEGKPGRAYVYLEDAECAMLKLLLRATSRGQGCAIRGMRMEGPEYASSVNEFFRRVAADSPPGLHPRYLQNKQSYWTVVGVPADTKKALVNEQGQIEVDKQQFSLEPFLLIDGRLVTWSDVSTAQYLSEDYLPMPIVEWKYKNLVTLDIGPCVAGYPQKSLLGILYRLASAGPAVRGRLFVAIRPFQVVPPWQQLNMEGGVSRVDSISYSQGFVHVNTFTIVPLTAPSGFGAAAFDEGEITDFLSGGRLPGRNDVIDHFRHASAALAYDFNLSQGASADFVVAVPWYGWQRSPVPNMNPASASLYFDLMSKTQAGRWAQGINNVRFDLPAGAGAVGRTIRTNLAYILDNREGPAIEPGARTYERSWIRDGAMISAALLRCGYIGEVRDFIDWYARYQYPDGKIPCVVDARGADPVPENDSNGEFIYAVLQYYLFTHDTTWLRGKSEAVYRAARYIVSMRAQRKTAEYRNGAPEQRALYGLVPESISHEGYSDHPRHSYWDDFFDLRGLKDAARIAEILGAPDLAREFSVERDDFRTDLYASMRLAMKNRSINYIPGCAELGDFDATSTTIGLLPGGELGRIPEPALHNTFDKYYRYFERRLTDTTIVNYTPYETRVVGSFVLLGQKQRAEAALNFFMRDRRPAAWNHWAEVVWRDRDTPKYIGDMPHTWVGSDFIRSVLTMFLYERERDNAVVLAAGIPDSWLEDSAGVFVSGLHTYGGTITYRIRKTGSHVVADVSGNVPVPETKMVLESPLSRKLLSVKVDGSRVPVPRTREVILRKLPARVDFGY